MIVTEFSVPSTTVTKRYTPEDMEYNIKEMMRAIKLSAAYASTVRAEDCSKTSHSSLSVKYDVVMRQICI